jgi:hypothetical protein
MRQRHKKCIFNTVFRNSLLKHSQILFTIFLLNIDSFENICKTQVRVLEVKVKIQKSWPIKILDCTLLI